MLKKTDKTSLSGSMMSLRQRQRPSPRLTTHSASGDGISLARVLPLLFLCLWQDRQASSPPQSFSAFWRKSDYHFCSRNSRAILSLLHDPQTLNRNQEAASLSPTILLPKHLLNMYFCLPHVPCANSHLSLWQV